MINKIKAMKLGDLLIYSGKLNNDQLTEALSLQKKTGQKLGEILVEKGWVNEKDIIETLEQQMGIERYDIQNNVVEAEIPKLITENLARRYLAIPVKINENTSKLTVAMYDPLNIYAIDDIEIATGLKIEPVLASKKDISSAIDQFFGKQNAEKAIEGIRGFFRCVRGPLLRKKAQRTGQDIFFLCPGGLSGQYSLPYLFSSFS